MEELQSLEKSCSVYLRLATELYMKCLILGNDEGNDLKVFRLVSLCLDNQSSDSLMRNVENLIQNIPSYKFLIVLNQLIVRLTDAPSRFNKLLINIIKKCSTEHPHHSLPLVLALANSYLDETFTSTAGDRNKRSVDILEPRIKVVRNIVAELERDESLGGLLREMTALVTAYVSMANFPIGDKKPGDYKLPSSEPLSKIKNLSVPCLTANISVKKNGKYTNLPEIIEFKRTYGLVGGINSPKKLCCLCSDGLEYVQLVKGQDDLRQDAGMQQVFGILNILLRNEESTAKRRLLIRTYKVIPVSQKSGVIEWVANTQPIGDYLVGDKGAHVRYRPQDISPLIARKKLVDGATKKTPGSGQNRIATPEEKYEAYMSICEQIKPVFRYFFIEKYPTPGVWFERRLAYTRSIATNSMIGYILGIGDRHVANILIDLFTAEVVHIDFGITFEFGRFLPTPETIPFRLTRDIVDGMGVSGTEGIFKRCCEETLSVLRKTKDPILTTLEVFLYDPLATWESSVKKVAAKRVQKNQVDSLHLVNSDESDKEGEGINTLAERCVQRLKEKLEGREDGNITSVEGQVSYLITNARNPRNLCTLFHGWQAYL
uniref:Serine/threonine-protein kinase ATM n=2 Tax=Lygus hesperus TaxID=30085 RepID=A0A146KLL5_LYGHE